MGKHYGFDADVAKIVGVDEAIMLENIAYWVDKNRVNGHNLYDGCYWTYNSAAAFSELFPFWTPKQVRRILGNLAKEYIQIGNYNKSPYDRTRWYSLTPKGVEVIFGAGKVSAFFPKDIPKEQSSILPNGKMCVTEQEHQSHETVTPIPNINTNINTNINREGVLPSVNHQAPTPTADTKRTKSKKAFIPPSLEEIKAYVAEKGITVSAERFYEYYSAGEWCDAKGNTVKNWKQKLLTWSRYEGGGIRNGTDNRKPVEYVPEAWEESTGPWEQR